MSVIIFKKDICFSVYNSIDDFLFSMKEIDSKNQEAIQEIIEKTATVFDKFNQLNNLKEKEAIQEIIKKTATVFDKFNQLNNLKQNKFLLLSEYALLDSLLSYDSAYRLDENESAVRCLRQLGYEVKEESNYFDGHDIVEISKNGLVFYKA